MIGRVLATLTRAGPVGGGAAATVEGPVSRHRAPDDLLDFQGFMMEQGWGDGLPLIPATPAVRSSPAVKKSADPWPTRSPSPCSATKAF